VFDRARRRLTLQAALLFAVLLVVFSVVFYAVLATVLAPTFDIAPELPNDEAARQAYGQAVQLIGVALLLANVVAIALALAAGYLLAGRTLRPIRSALERQRRFVADASHEMRTPLTVIRSTVDEALASPADVERARSSLQLVSQATDRLAAMTADLLLLARTEDGTRMTDRLPVDLSVAVAEAVTAIRMAAGAEISQTLEPDLVVLAEDEAATRIASALIDNAWRYSHGARVEVRTFSHEGTAVLEVEDHGPGIAAADIEQIFEPFHRLRADRGAPQGTGLGLTIARNLARSWGGGITVRSRPGRGSVFRVELPRAG
jgi:signal transduction histidine kinase